MAGAEPPSSQPFTLGWAYKHRRKQLRIPQQGLEEFGISRGTVQRIESDNPEVTRGSLEKYAAGLQTTLEELDHLWRQHEKARLAPPDDSPKGPVTLTATDEVVSVAEDSSRAVNPDEAVRRVATMFREGWQQHVALEVMKLSEDEAQDVFTYIINKRRGLSPSGTTKDGT